MAATLTRSSTAPRIAIVFGGRFGAGVDFPGALRRLKLGNSFNRPLEAVKLPSTLESLTLGESFAQSLEAVNFPKSHVAEGLGWPEIAAKRHEHGRFGAEKQWILTKNAEKAWRFPDFERFPPTSSSSSLGRREV